ncbi:MAG: hypothetical protein Q8L27_01865 [archaeon]|nr:hypothetical protein [archaeon]
MKKQKTKKVVKKAVVKKAKKQEVCNCCRKPSNKSKESKVQKMKKLAGKNSHRPKKKGFFGRIFSK